MKILLAIDDSKSSEAAIQMVIAQAKPENTELRLLHVLPLPSLLIGRELGAYDLELETVWEAQRGNAKELLAKAAATLRSAGFNPMPELEEGDPKSSIIDAAKEWKADLIVLGSHGRKALDRFLMGSVAEGVARHANCSVEIVRLPSQDAAAVAPRK